MIAPPMMVLTLSAILLAQGAAAPQEQKAPVPDAAELKKAKKTIRDVFRDEYAKRDPEGQRDLARLLLAQEKKTRDEPAARFALLSEAWEIAAGAADVETAFASIDRLSASFEVDAAALKEEALKKARSSARTLKEFSAVAHAYFRLAGEAFGKEDYDAALQLARDASSLARKAREKELAASATELAKTIPAMKKEHEAAEKAKLLLSVNPEDPQANLTLGRFLCLVRGKWDEGLPLLAIGSDEKLKAAAKRDLAKPEEAQDRLRAGDAWWGLAESTKDFTRTSFQQRAAHWYRLAQPDLKGISAIKARERLGRIEEVLSKAGASRGTGGASRKLPLSEVAAMLGLTDRGWKIQGDHLEGRTGSIDSPEGRFLSLKPVAASSFRFGFRIRAKWYHIIMLRIDGREYWYSRGHWHNSGEFFVINEEKIRNREGHKVKSAETWNALAVELVGGNLRFFYDGKETWKGRIPQPPRGKHVIHFGFGCHDTTVGVKDFTLQLR